MIESSEFFWPLMTSQRGLLYVNVITDTCDDDGRQYCLSQKQLKKAKLLPGASHTTGQSVYTAESWSTCICMGQLLSWFSPSSLILFLLRVECVSFRICDYTAIVCTTNNKRRRVLHDSVLSPRQWSMGTDRTGLLCWSNIINESERTPGQCSRGPRSNVSQQKKLCGRSYSNKCDATRCHLACIEKWMDNITVCQARWIVC